MARHLAVLVLLGALCLGNAAPSVHTVGGKAEASAGDCWRV